MKILALIPARGGSKRCPGKNMADLGGKPLLAWTIEAAKHFFVLQHTHHDINIGVSTDDEETAFYAHERGIIAYARPRQLANDDTPMLPVVRDIVDALIPDVIILLQPTSPFRTGDDIRHAWHILNDRNADSVVSVTDAPNDWAYQVRHAGRLEMLPNIVRDNGAIYIITREALERGEDWYSGQCYAYVMPKDRSLDIDTPLDLEIARAIVAQRKAA